ncbi:TylF/MycF/NovP-related O-methyltransferase [Arenibaculum pallidiluteum]|uniref:TylF/MycF/NovP-related O-methyltransferase n=1 Tax=Arenibaculum pallidiluteum TaxID=2812559 RepID=UPI002E2C2CEF|nr:class I SAM-dependent methyltransferase [Arenibaculum pallidiluteum]
MLRGRGLRGGGLSAVTQEPARDLAQARSLIGSGRYDAALRLLECLPAGSEVEGLLGAARLGRREHAQARLHLRRALEQDPADLDALLRLGRAHLLAGDAFRAVTLLQRAAASGHPRGLPALAGALRRDARFRDAIRLAGGSADPDLLYEKGISHHALGEPAKALEALDRLLALDPEHGAGWFASHGPALSVEGPEGALERLRRATACRGANRKYLGQLCALLLLLGRDGEAEAVYAAGLARHPGQRHMVEAVRALLPHMAAGWRLFGVSAELLRHALSLARGPGLVLEFGVRRGTSLEVIAAAAGQEVHGFDSFEGLPEAWGKEAAGTYTTGGELPSVIPGARLHPGWFEDTLPAFLAADPSPLRFANIDCDIYSSTRTVLEGLADRLRPGTILVFDEYVGNRTWRDHEYRAFTEFAAARSIDFDYVAVGPATKQVAVRIRSILGNPAAPTVQL